MRSGSRPHALAPRLGGPEVPPHHNHLRVRPRPRLGRGLRPRHPADKQFSRAGRKRGGRPCPELERDAKKGTPSSTGTPLGMESARNWSTTRRRAPRTAAGGSMGRALAQIWRMGRGRGPRRVNPVRCGVDGREGGTAGGPRVVGRRTGRGVARPQPTGPPDARGAHQRVPPRRLGSPRPERDLRHSRRDGVRRPQAARSASGW